MKEAKEYVDELQTITFEQLDELLGIEAEKRLVRVLEESMTMVWQNKALQSELLQRVSQLEPEQARVALLGLLKGMTVDEAIDFSKFRKPGRRMGWDGKNGGRKRCEKIRQDGEGSRRCVERRMQQDARDECDDGLAEYYGKREAS